MENEQRKAPRIAFRLNVLMKGKKIPGKILNFSTAGLLIYTPYALKFKPGDEIDLLLKFPLEKRRTVLQGLVVRVHKKGIAVRFSQTGADESAQIRYCFEVFRWTYPLPGT
jgi:hypothetical protein